jgi:hypothetical protein
MNEALVSFTQYVGAGTLGWWRDILHHRVCELKDACFAADGTWCVPAQSPVWDLIEKAERCHEIDEFEYCEDHCVAAEAAIIRARVVSCWLVKRSGP